MMKKFMLVLVTLLTAVLATACGMDSNVKINRDGTADTRLQFVLQNEMFEQGLGEQLQSKFETDGFTVNVQDNDDATKTIVAEKQTKGDETISVLPIDLFAQGSIKPVTFLTRENLFTKTYILKDDLTLYLMNMQQFGSAATITLTIELPNRPSYSNATSVENGGKTLMWTFDQTNTSVELIANVQKTSAIVIYCIIAILVILLLLWLLKKRRRDTEEVISPTVLENIAENEEQNGEFLIEENADIEESGEEEEIAETEDIDEVNDILDEIEESDEDTKKE